MWPWKGRGPWECEVDFSDAGLGAEEREADRSRDTNGISGLGPSDPSLPPLQASAEPVPLKSSQNSLSAH